MENQRIIQFLDERNLFQVQRETGKYEATLIDAYLITLYYLRESVLPIQPILSIIKLKKSSTYDILEKYLTKLADLDDNSEFTEMSSRKEYGEAVLELSANLTLEDLEILNMKVVMFDLLNKLECTIKYYGSLSRPIIINILKHSNHRFESLYPKNNFSEILIEKDNERSKILRNSCYTLCRLKAASKINTQIVREKLKKIQIYNPNPVGRILDELKSVENNEGLFNANQGSMNSLKDVKLSEYKSNQVEKEKTAITPLENSEKKLKNSEDPKISLDVKEEKKVSDENYLDRKNCVVMKVGDGFQAFHLKDQSGKFVKTALHKIEDLYKMMNDSKYTKISAGFVNIDLEFNFPTQFPNRSEEYEFED